MAGRKEKVRPACWRRAWGGLVEAQPAVQLSTDGKAIVGVALIILDQRGEHPPDHPPRRRRYPDLRHPVRRCVRRCVRGQPGGETLRIAKGKIKAHEQPGARRLAALDLAGEEGFGLEPRGKFSSLWPIPARPGAAAADPNRVRPLDRDRSGGPVYGDKRIERLHDPWLPLILRKLAGNSRAGARRHRSAPDQALGDHRRARHLDFARTRVLARSAGAGGGEGLSLAAAIAAIDRVRGANGLPSAIRQVLYARARQAQRSTES